jgi:hypothetical protein
MGKFYCVFVLIFLAHIHLYSGGKMELPDEYFDLGIIEINKKYTGINLPYIKPKGINKIITNDIHGLIIEEIIVNGKIIKPHKIFLSMGTYEHISHLYEDDVNLEEGKYFLKMNWIKIDTENEIFYEYFSRNGKIRYSPDYYKILFGANEVYIIYKVRFIGNEITDFRNYFVSDEMYIIKFNLEWK